MSGNPRGQNAILRRSTYCMQTASFLVCLLLCVLLLGGSAYQACPIIQTTTLANGKVGTPYAQTLTATGNLPMEWFLQANSSLPGGLSLNKDTGIISGTPVTSGCSTFTVIARNYDGFDTRTFSIKIQDPALAPVVTTTQLPDATEGNAYSIKLQADGTLPITWALADGYTLPAGLQLSESGMLSGTPETSGVFPIHLATENFDGFGTKVLSLRIFSKYPHITTISLPSGTVGIPYAASLSATGKTGIQWQVIGNALPEGLTLNTSTGYISGTPKVGGAYHFLVRADNGEGGGDTASLTISIAAPPTITSAVLADGRAGIPYARTLSATGDAPLIWSVSRGNLPDGLNLNSLTGVLSGTPTKPGEFTFTIMVINNDGYDSRQFHIQITGSAPVITTTVLADAVEGRPYSATIAASGSVPITWSYTGTLPDGLSLNSVSGQISGTPTDMGTFSFVIRATNSSGFSSQPMSVTVLPAAPVILTTTLPKAIIDTPYYAKLDYTGSKPMQWSVVNSTLPAGLHLDTASGIITGYPERIEEASFQLLATNAAGSVSRHFTISVNSQFTDIADHWAYADILWAYARGLFGGDSPTTFSPKGAMSRGMFVTVLHRYAGLPMGSGGKQFTDIPQGSYYEQAVAWAAGDNIVTGISPTTFEPNRNISRQDLVLLLFRYSNEAGLDTSSRADLSTYADSRQVGHWAQEALSWAADTGIIRGTDKNEINPKGTASRAEAAAIFRRYIELFEP